MPRFAAPLLKQTSLPLPAGWDHTTLRLPGTTGPLVDLMTERAVQRQDSALAIEDILRDFPVAVLVPPEGV